MDRAYGWGVLPSIDGYFLNGQLQMEIYSDYSTSCFNGPFTYSIELILLDTCLIY